MVDSSLGLEYRARSPLPGSSISGLTPSSRRTDTCRVEARFFAPPPDLEGCFTTFYRLELKVAPGERVVDYLQPEWGNLRFFDGSAPDCRIAGSPPVNDAHFIATGPSTLPGRFELGQTRMWGVGLFPLGWARFIGVPATDMANRVLDGTRHAPFNDFTALARDLFAGPPDDEAEYAILVDEFRARFRMVRDEAAIRAVHEAIVDSAMASVAELAARAGMTARSLERLCAKHFGFPPKQLLRRQRFMRTLSAFMTDRSNSWSQVIDRRYHDQAHFVRDFQQFMLMSPSEYAAMEHPVLSAFMAERKRILGSPAQTLDQP